MPEEYYQTLKKRISEVFSQNKELYCPYFKTKITLNSDGFHHLQFSARRERDKNEQILKFSLVPYALEVIKSAGTVQVYRKILEPIGKKGKDGLRPTKYVEYWAFVAIVFSKDILIRVILRRVGDGKIIFWSVMRDSKLNNGQQGSRSQTIEDI